MKSLPLLLALGILLSACSEQKAPATHDSDQPPQVTSSDYIPSDSPVGREIEKIFAGQEDEEGDVDVDGVIEALDRLLGLVSRDDLPELLAALESPRNSFWTRELLAEPIAKVGGLATLPELLGALHKNTAEGHDNDHLAAILINLVEAEPIAAQASLKSLSSDSDPRTVKAADWLLQFAK